MASALVTHPTRLRWQGVLVWLVASAAAGLCVALSLRAARADGGFPAPGQETLLLGIALFAATQGVLWLAFLHRRAAGRLHAAEAVIAALLRHTGTAVFSTGPDGVIRTFNAEAERLLGWTAQEVAGVRRPDFFHDRAELAARAKRVGEKLQREIEPGFDALVAGGADGEEEECILLRKDGTRVPVRLALSALRDRHGRLEGWLGLATDITAQRRSEQVLREASDAAQESARVKSRFLANMSHEIRTPMNGVVGMTGLLLDTDLSPEQRGLAETVRASADALLTIINDILDFSKIEAGQLAFEELPFDLREPIENCLALVAGKAHEKNLELAYLVEENVPAQLVGDSGRLHQVLLNLVSNAVKFTERGEVVVRVARERERDRRVLLRFSVRDTGIGIPTNVQRRLFQPFVQADGSTTRRFGGTGLGLAICRQLVGLMHGQIGLDSAPDLGSLFWFTAEFPLQDAAPKVLPRRADLTGLRTLVVDDNATNRDFLARQLGLWRMNVTQAADGREALDKLQLAASAGTPFQLALLDMQMPFMTGLELAGAVHADPALGSPRIIILSSLGHVLSRPELDGAGVSLLLPKPVRQAQLHDALTTIAATRAPKAPPAEFSNGARSPAPAAALPLRILVAEDNLVNQQVARMQLERLGYRCAIVADGRAAVVAVQTQAYDVAIMDCHMPELDGFEATRRIRSWEDDRRMRGETFVPLHIIAMTANAMVGDREACLAAGMNDYMSKPVRAPDLAAALARAPAAPA